MRFAQRVLSVFQRSPRVPLSARRPDVTGAATQTQHPSTLGLEAIDMDVVNAANRRNDALERVAGAGWTGNKGANEGRATYVPPMPEDETYAATYHAVWNRKKGERK